MAQAAVSTAVAAGVSAVTSLTSVGRERIALSYKEHYNEEQVKLAVMAIFDRINQDTKALRQVDFKTASDVMQSWLASPDFAGSALSIRRLDSIREHSARAVNAVSDPMDKLTAIGMLILSSYHYAILTSASGTSSDESMQHCWLEGKKEAQRLLKQYIEDFNPLITAANEEMTRGLGMFQDKRKRRELLLQYARLGHSVYLLHPHSLNDGHPRFPLMEDAVRKVAQNRHVSLWAPARPIINNPYVFGNLRGHTEAIHCCAVFNDERRLVSGSGDETLRIWDLTSGQCVRTLVGHGGWVNCCALFDEERQLVSGSSDHKVNIWDLETGQCTQTLQGHTGAVFCCSVFDDGGHLISGSQDKTLKIWNLGRMECSHTLTGHIDTVSCCTIFEDGLQLVSGSFDKTLKVWDLLQTVKCKRTLTGRIGRILCCSVFDDGKQVVAGGGNNRLQIWDLTSGLSTRTLKGHTGSIWCCAVLDDRKQLVSGGDDNTLRLWDLTTGNSIYTFTGHDGWVLCCSVFNEGRQLVSGSWDETLKLWALNR